MGMLWRDRRGSAAWWVAAALSLCAVGDGALTVASASSPEPVIETIAGGPGAGPATQVAQIPAGLALSGGKVYIADPVKQVVRAVDQQTRREKVVAGEGGIDNLGRFSGDGGPAIEAQLYDPAAVAFDSHGSLYIADTDNNRVREVRSDGVITTVAGTGRSGYSGDGGPATKADLAQPLSVAVSASGDLYISDLGNNRVRRVDSSGRISTYVGLGVRGFAGDGRPAALALLSGPSGLAFDTRGDLLIADSGNNCVRKVTAASPHIVTTVAGVPGSILTAGYNGDGIPALAAQLNSPMDVAVDGNGQMYIADMFNQRIRMVDKLGIIHTVAGTGTAGYNGDGLARMSTLAAPTSVRVDAVGRIYIADQGNARVRVVSPVGRISTLAGDGSYTYGGDGGPATSAELGHPSSLAIDAHGDVLIADYVNNRIRKVDPSGSITTIAGGDGSGRCGGDGGPAIEAGICAPMGIAVGPTGDIFIVEQGDFKVRRIAGNGIITTVAGDGYQNSNTGYGRFTGDGGPATRASLNWPMGIVAASDGGFYIADTANERVRKVDSSGVITTAVGTGQHGFNGDGHPGTDTELSQPEGVTLDAVGNLYIADFLNRRVRKLDGGVVETVAGSGVEGFSGDGGPATAAQLGGPTGVAVDASGTLFIADIVNRRVREVSASGQITTVAGNGDLQFYGDGGPATAAALSGPQAVSIDAAGNLLIADFPADRVRDVARTALATSQGTEARGASTPPAATALRARHEPDLLLRPAFRTSSDQQLPLPMHPAADRANLPRRSDILPLAALLVASTSGAMARRRRHRTFAGKLSGSDRRPRRRLT